MRRAPDLRPCLLSAWWLSRGVLWSRSMSERAFDDPTLPPPGRRSGAGSASIVPYLLKTLATRPQAAAIAPPGPASAPPPVSAARPGGGAAGSP
jgi:hypothetical protein